MKMNPEQQKACDWYVKDHNTAKEIARKLRRTEKTIGNWVKKYGWKTLRTENVLNSKGRITRIREILNEYAELSLYYLQLSKEAREHIEKAKKKSLTDSVTYWNDRLSEAQSELNKIDDRASKKNKELQSLLKEDELTISVELDAMDNIFEELRHFNEALYLKTLEFQTHYIVKLSTRYE